MKKFPNFIFDGWNSHTNLNQNDSANRLFLLNKSDKTKFYAIFFYVWQRNRQEQYDVHGSLAASPNTNKSLVNKLQKIMEAQ